MKIPNNMTSEEVIEVIQRVSKRLAGKFAFGYYDRDDIEQEAFFIACDGLESYDESRPLENFLSVHLNNRLTNFRRDNYYRAQKPCAECNGVLCERCERRSFKINSKKNLMDPINIQTVRDENESNMRLHFDYLKKLENEEVSVLIDKFLPLEYRIDYLKMLEGVHVPKNRRIKIESIILEIIEDAE
jgi:DNA-directed RNA polymerase specialized sigma24 family protein